MDQYQASIPIYLDLAKKFRQEKESRNYLLAINKASISQVYLQKYEEALGTLRKAENSIELIHPRDSLMADYFYAYGQAYNYLNQGDSSKKYHIKALEIRDEIYDHPVLSLADSYIGLGNVFTYSLYDYSQGQDYYEKALREIHDMGDSISDETLLRCYYNLANIHKTLRNLDKGEYYADGALKLSYKINNTVFQRYCHNLMAIIFEHKGDYVNSLHHFQKVISLLENQSSKDYYFIGVTHLNLALDYYNKGDYAKALDWIEKALTLFREKQLTENTHYALLLVHYGWIKFRSDENIDDIHYIIQGIDKLKELSSGKDNLVNAYSILSQCFVGNQQYREGIESIKQGIRFLQSDSNTPHSSPFFNNYRAYQLFSHLADAQLNLYEKTGEDIGLVEDALDNYLKSDSLLRIVKSKNLLESDELDISKKSQSSVKNAIQCIKLLAENKTDSRLTASAIKIIEQNKSRILYKAIKKAEYQKTAGVPDSLIQKWRDINQQINYLQGEKNNDKIKERLLALTKELEFLNNYLSAHYPNYVKYTTGGDDISITALKSYAKQQNTVILNYYYDENNLMVVSIKPDDIGLFFVQNDSSLRHYLKEFYANFSETDPTSLSKFHSFTRSAHYLYDKLVSPGVTGIPDSINRLVIIPDKQLATIPFESLIKSVTTGSDINYKNLDYLLNDFEVNYHHSLSFLLQTEDGSTIKKPSFGGWGYTRLNHQERQLSPLTYAIEEISAISEGFNRELYIENEATESSFKKNIDEYDIVHLSIHGSSSFRGEPCLFFNADSTNDGIIQASELYNLKNKSKMIVLSSCESGVGEVIPGEGTMSIARGFFYTGCPSILISLSTITDRSSTTLQKAFYENLKSGYRKGKALQLSKIDYIKNSDRYTAHPAHWAPPVLMGSSDIVFSPTKGADMYSVIAAMFVLLIAAILVFKLLSRTSTNQ